MRRLFPIAPLSLVVAVALAIGVLATPARADEVVSEDWYAVYIGDTKAGHAHTRIGKRVEPTAAGGVVWITETASLFRLSRLGNEMLLRVISQIEEDGVGRVRRFRHAQSMSDEEIVTEGRTNGSRIVLTSAGIETEVDYPAGALGPYAVDQRVRAAGLATGTATEAAAFSTDSPGRAARMTFRIADREPRSILGRRLVLHRCDVRNSASSARGSAMWLDIDGRMLESVSEVPGIGSLRMVKADERLARAVSSPAEIFASSLVTPDRGIPSPRRSAHAVLRLKRKTGAAFGDTVPSGRGQSVGPGENGAVLVTLDNLSDPTESRHARPVTDTAHARYLARAPYLETNDAEVVRHAALAVGDERDALKCALRIERYVRSHVSDKGFDVGFASAAEVVRRREGDCTEHAVLAAALARVVGLPARVVAGLVYLPGMSAEGVGPKGAFGYHMWTEVLVAEGVWRPIDAALGGFDATHVALGRSDLALDSPIGDLVLPLLETIRDLVIEVVEVR